jgi:hypothetical protein
MTRKELIKIMDTAETGNDMLALADKLAALVDTNDQQGVNSEVD